MRRPGWWPLLVLAAALSLVAAACGGQQPAGGGGETGSPAEPDLLQQILDAGVLRVATDPAYPPASFLNEETGEWEGFDVDVAREIAKRLGVELEFVTPAWETITAGNWQGRWDLSVGSMTVTPERAEVLHFVTPYYYTPAAVAVREEDADKYRDIATDFDGKTIGVCGGCTYDFYLRKTLNIPGEEIDFVIDDADIRTYDTDTTAIADLVAGRLDAVISAEPILQGAIDRGRPIVIVGRVFYEPLSVAIDKNAPADPTTFVERVDQIIKEMHADGTLSRLSVKWFGTDLTVKE
jgi:polar amino acid transport system substrate-binding protein